MTTATTTLHHPATTNDDERRNIRDGVVVVIVVLYYYYYIIIILVYLAGTTPTDDTCGSLRVRRLGLALSVGHAHHHHAQRRRRSSSALSPLTPLLTASAVVAMTPAVRFDRVDALAHPPAPTTAALIAAVVLR
jgi:hypothetical protein